MAAQNSPSLSTPTSFAYYSIAAQDSVVHGSSVRLSNNLQCRPGAHRA
jgi:hypothetical protein